MVSPPPPPKALIETFLGQKCFLLHFWPIFGSRLKTEGTYRIRFVRPSVRACVTAYLRNRSEDFSETWHEVGGKKCKKHSTAAFLRFRPVFAKNPQTW
jgi:hypothetical protein